MPSLLSWPAGRSTWATKRPTWSQQPAPCSTATPRSLTASFVVASGTATDGFTPVGSMRPVPPALLELLIEVTPRLIADPLRYQDGSIGTRPVQVVLRASRKADHPRFAELATSACNSPLAPMRSMVLEELPSPVPDGLRGEVRKLAHDSEPAVVTRALPLLVTFDADEATRAFQRLAATAPRLAARCYPDLRAVVPTSTLVKLLSNPDPAARAAACTAAERLRDPELIAPLLQRMGDSDPTVRTAARKAIEAIRFHAETQDWLQKRKR